MLTKIEQIKVCIFKSHHRRSLVWFCSVVIIIVFSIPHQAVTSLTLTGRFCLIHRHPTYCMSIVTKWHSFTMIDCHCTLNVQPPFSRFIPSCLKRNPFNKNSSTRTPLIIKNSLPYDFKRSSWGHVIQWTNRFDPYRRNTRHCSDSTTARHRAMFGPSQLGAYTRVSLRSSNTYVYLWKSRGGQCGIQDVSCLLLIRGNWRGKDTWEYGIWAARREPFVNYGRGP